MNGALQRSFAAIGARLDLQAPPWNGRPRIDAGGHWFSIRFVGDGDPAELQVLDVDGRDRHLLLLVRSGGEKSKFLCGRDERDLFVAAIPEDARGVTGVATAKAALQPPAVREAVERCRPKRPFSRRNAAFVRQGEWFFVPAPDLQVDERLALRDEPLRRALGTAHVMQLAHRRGGTPVWLSRYRGQMLGDAEYALLPRSRRGEYRLFVRDPELYAKGTVRHPDHATIVLPTWHRVLMNTEQGARAMQHVVFLD